MTYLGHFFHDANNLPIKKTEASEVVTRENQSYESTENEKAVPLPLSIQEFSPEYVLQFLFFQLNNSSGQILQLVTKVEFGDYKTWTIHFKLV